jgi:DNA-directed RNA polymerase subunit RPC12/RpoP
MPITVPCVKCKAKFQVPSKLAGTTVRCKSCGAMLRLPSPERIQAKKQGATAGKSARASKPSPSSKAPVEALESFDLFESADLETELLKPLSPEPAAPPAPEPTVLSCSHCEGLLYYDPNFANQTVACPHCGNHLIMPQL